MIVHGVKTMKTKKLVTSNKDRKNAKRSPRTVKKDSIVRIDGERKPKILLISDVKGWAWWNKSEFLKEYLSDEFNIHITCAIEPQHGGHIEKGKFDLYFTYGYSYVDYVTRKGVPKDKIVTGVTAHRPHNTIRGPMNRAGNLHANSLMLKKELENMGYTNVHYVPNGVDEKLFKVVDPIPEHRSNIVVGHVGKACKAKGQQDYIKPAVTYAGALGFYNFNDYTKKTPLNQMWKIYNQMDVFIVASVEDGTPNPALEAAACGRPIISNRIGNMPEFIEHGVNGFLLDTRNVKEYAKYITKLGANRKLLMEMGRNARATIEKDWTWKVQAERYRDMFRKIFRRV